jgi:hypothetical protein
MSLSTYEGETERGREVERERGILHIKLRVKEYITSSVVNIPYAVVSVVSYKFFKILAEGALIFDSAG